MWWGRGPWWPTSRVAWCRRRRRHVSAGRKGAAVGVGGGGSRPTRLYRAHPPPFPFPPSLATLAHIDGRRDVDSVAPPGSTSGAARCPALPGGAAPTRTLHLHHQAQGGAGGHGPAQADVPPAVHGRGRGQRKRVRARRPQRQPQRPPSHSRWQGLPQLVQHSQGGAAVQGVDGASCTPRHRRLAARSRQGLAKGGGGRAGVSVTRGGVPACVNRLPSPPNNPPTSQHSPHLPTPPSLPNTPLTPQRQPTPSAAPIFPAQTKHFFDPPSLPLHPLLTCSARARAGMPL